MEERFSAWSAIADEGDFEAAMAALEESVALLEEGGLPLASMTACYELGLRLSRRSSALLSDAELRITVLEQSFAEEASDSNALASAGSRQLFEYDE